MKIRAIQLFGVAIFTFVGSAIACAAPQAAQPETKQGTPAAGLKDRAELESFLDGVIAAQKDSHNIMGATVAVVAGGELFLAKGYGLADKTAGKKVEPDKTLFRIGSVSKLFTWTAVMQLVEQGKLDLKADVNRYLTGFRVPDTYAEPITMINLTTHTPGFEDHVLGLFSHSSDSMRPLGEILAGELPARVRPPGMLASYSNHGTALAGYIVQLISGIPFEQYIEQNILQPLDMKHTSVRQPVPADLVPDMSVGYRFANGEHKPEGFEFVPASPAGAMSASAVDMAHFMIAHLQGGHYGSARILSEATARQMHSRLFGHVPQLNGMMYGFYEMNRNGRRIYGHGGDTLWFHTELALLPDENVGLFVSYNSDSGAPARDEIVKAFIDRYFPPRGAPEASIRIQEPAGMFEGSYRTIRMSYTSLAKIAGLMSVAHVKELADGRLLTTGLGRNPKRWVEIEPLVFREVDGQDKLAFGKDAQGRITHLFVSFPAMAFEKLSLVETPGFHYTATAISLGLLVSALIAWPIIAWSSRRKDRGNAPPRLARIVLWLAAALFLFFFVGLLVVLADPMQIAFGVPASLKALLVLPLLAAVLMIAAVVFIAMAWKRKYWRTSARVYYTLVAAAGLVFLWLLNYWNLFGYHFR